MDAWLVYSTVLGDMTIYSQFFEAGIWLGKASSKMGDSVFINVFEEVFFICMRCPSMSDLTSSKSVARSAIILFFKLLR